MTPFHVLAAVLLCTLRAADATRFSRLRLDAHDIVGAMAWRSVARHWWFQRERLLSLWGAP